MENMPKLKRFVTGFYRKGKEGVAVKYELSIPLSFLQELFNIPVDHEDLGWVYMLDGYPIGKKEATALQPYVRGPIDIDKYIFMLTCESAE